MLRFLLSLPPVVYFVFAAILVGFGFYADSEKRAEVADRALALQGEAPAIVDLGAITAADAGTADEVNIAAQVNGDHIYSLHKDSDNDSNAHVLYMLFGTDATDQERVVQAAIVLPLRQDDQLFEWMTANIQDDGPMSPVFHLNGIKASSTSYSDVARDAFSDNGFQRGPEFFYLHPFLEGRKAGLAPRTSDANSLKMPAWIAALLLALFGGGKMLMRRR